MFATVLVTLAALCLLCAGEPVLAGETAKPASPPTFPLWPGKAPFAKGDGPGDKPSLQYFPAPAERATGAAVVVCPGGGYQALMTTYEGEDIARWLNRFGITAVVLRYRVKYLHPAPLLDAQRALRVVRSRAQEWKLDPLKIGAIGFSAGGHLVATLGTHWDEGLADAADPLERVSCRPDFLMMVYPVITMGEKGTPSCRTALLGPKPTPEQVDDLSDEKHVTARTPPAFLVHAVTDQLVPVENSRSFYKALQEKGVPAEYLELPQGAHGLGCGKGALWAAWQGKCQLWLAGRGLAKPEQAP